MRHGTGRVRGDVPTPGHYRLCFTKLAISMHGNELVMEMDLGKGLLLSSIDVHGSDVNVMLRAVRQERFSPSAVKSLRVSHALMTGTAALVRPDPVCASRRSSGFE